MLFQEMFLVNFKGDPGRPIQETIALTRDQYLKFIEAEKSITLGEEFTQNSIEDAENLNGMEISGIRGVVDEVYQKYLKKPKLLQPQDERIVCGYCGFEGRTLKRHLSKKHDVEQKAYLSEFNLPPDMSLACLNMQNAGASRMAAYWESPAGKARKKKGEQTSAENGKKADAKSKAGSRATKRSSPAPAV